jgi:RNA-splicing ligase RtcB
MNERENDVIEEDVELDDVALDSGGSTDNVGETSVEFDVEDLIAEVEAEVPDGVDRDGKMRKRLEEVLEKKQSDEELTDLEDYDV